MEWVIWGMAGLGGVVAMIIGIAAWITLRRDRNLPNQRIRTQHKPGTTPRSSGTVGVPRSR